MGTFLNFSKEKQKKCVLELPISAIIPNPQQPRTAFDAAAITSLAESIRQNGILQPLSIRQTAAGYELIAGERRLRAAKLAKLTHVPCIVHQMNERSSAVMALVENIQRQNLSFFDEANAIEKLISCYGMTQEDAAIQLGKAQSTIANKLRLLKLCDTEKEQIVQNNLTERHARALLKLESPLERQQILMHVIRHGLNVERTEQYIADYLTKGQEKAAFQKRSIVFRNVKLFVNTINKAVEMMNAAGIPAHSRRMQYDDYIEYQIRIPLIK